MFVNKDFFDDDDDDRINVNTFFDDLLNEAAFFPYK